MLLSIQIFMYTSKSCFVFFYSIFYCKILLAILCEMYEQYSILWQEFLKGFDSGFLL